LRPGVFALSLYLSAFTEVVCENFDPLLVLASIHEEPCMAVYGVPTMFIAELNHPMFGKFDLTSLHTGIMAGSPCPIEVMQRVIGFSASGGVPVRLLFADLIP
jgi:acyl-CoA synthetase (AMP-forming)/AMP-acid ligase II